MFLLYYGITRCIFSHSALWMHRGKKFSFFSVEIRLKFSYFCRTEESERDLITSVSDIMCNSERRFKVESWTFLQLRQFPLVCFWLSSFFICINIVFCRIVQFLIFNIINGMWLRVLMRMPHQISYFKNPFWYFLIRI